MSKSEYTMIEAGDVESWSAETAEADVVIIGLGCAGICAAISAREAGADVLVFERASGGGGVTGLAAGHLYLGGGTRVQKAVGVEDTSDDMFTYLMMNTPEPDETKIRLYCDESVEHFDWLVERGVPFNDTMYKGKHVLQMTDECLIWSGNEEVYPFREKAKPAPRGHKVAQVGELGGAKMMECLQAKAASSMTPRSTGSSARTAGSSASAIASTGRKKAASVRARVSFSPQVSSRQTTTC